MRCAKASRSMTRKGIVPSSATLTCVCVCVCARARLYVRRVVERMPKKDGGRRRGGGGRQGRGEWGALSLLSLSLCLSSRPLFISLVPPLPSPCFLGVCVCASERASTRVSVHS